MSTLAVQLTFEASPVVTMIIKQLHLHLHSSTGEIRTIIVNWPVHTVPSFKGPMEHLEMSIKPLNRWAQLSASDFGLKERDSDSHTPYLYLLRKAATVGRRADRHVRSEAGKQKDTEKRKQKKRENRAKK